MNTCCWISYCHLQPSLPEDFPQLRGPALPLHSRTRNEHSHPPELSSLSEAEGDINILAPLPLRYVFCTIPYHPPTGIRSQVSEWKLVLKQSLIGILIFLVLLPTLHEYFWKIPLHLHFNSASITCFCWNPNI